MKRTLLLSLALCGLAAFAADVTDVKVKALDGFGGDAAGAVLSRCQVKTGTAYDPVVVSRDVTMLRDSKEFEEISADAQRTADGVEVTFYVKRKMRFVAPIIVEGNDYLSAGKITREADLRDGYLYGESDLAEAAKNVRKAYLKKHFIDAKVTPVTTSVGGDNVTVTLVIDEGQRQEVRSFAFDGAEHALDVSCWKRLFGSLPSDSFNRSELNTAVSDYPWWNPIGWFTDAPFSADQLVQGCEKIAEVYRNYGYLDVEVTGPERIPVGDGEVDLRYTVKEGVQYRVGDISIQGLTSYPEDVVRSKSMLPPAGTIAGAKLLEDAAHRISVVVGSGDSGLADTRVAVQTLPGTNDAAVVDLNFQVVEGVPVVIDDIKVRGNDYTKDKVIRRAIELAPGDRMLADRAERSQRKLENLNYFSRVRYYLEPSERGKDANGAEYRNLVYEVEEHNTGSFMVGIGASSVDSVYISAEVSQNNFDLFAPSKLFRGGGQKGRLFVAWGPRYQSAEVGFSEPHFLDRYLELNVDAYRRLRWYDEYDLIRSGAMVSLSYPVKFWPTWEAFGSLGFGISGEFIEFDDTDDDDYVYGDEELDLFKMEERKYGDAFEPVLHVFWSRDSRDSFRMPTRGSRTRLFADIAPGGDNQYWRIGINHRSYFNVWKRYNHVLMIGLRAETIDAFSGDVPIYNRMFLGGPKSIRGIEYRNVAPMVRRADSSSYAPWGGQTLFCMNFEYTIPVVQMLRLAVFSDLGSVGEDVFDFDFSDTFAWTVGLGVRLDIPMFPIRLDFGVPVVKPDHADEEAFSFTVGYDF